MATNKQEQSTDIGIIGSRFTHLINYLAGIRKMSTLAKQERHREALIDAIMTIVFEHLDAEEVSLYFMEEELLQCVANLNWEKFIENSSAIGNFNRSFKLGEKMVGKTASERQVQHIKNCALDEQTSASDHGYAAGSALYAPIMTGTKLTGVIELFHPYSNHFDHWQEYAVSIYADLIAMLLDYNLLINDMQGQIDTNTMELQLALKESEKLRKRYEEMSIIDHLTRLYNRRFFFNEVASGLSRAIRYDQPFSLLLMDLDHFKNINDSYGHDAGDEALKNIANALSRFTREGDTLARYGGEEFVLSLPNTNIDGANMLAERIRTTIESNNWEWKGQRIGVTISIGVTSMHQHAETEEDFVNYHPQVADLIREADRALYYVKQHGRNAVKSFNELPNS